jgi:queuine tRNA-ribosyltransferase
VRFEVLATDGPARRGRLTTPHGVIETPAFMPVGTLGAVKGVPPDQLEAAGAEVMLSNLYHLALRPGVGVVEDLGGLHGFSGWQRPILTDSGGYQVFSLAALRAIDDGGVTFRSHLDGAALRFTPQSVVKMQGRLGVDVAMVLDECPPWPTEEAEAERSWRRTLAWARASAEERGRLSRPPDAVFGIVQGGVFRKLRERAAAELAELGFDGLAIGGVSVGEPAAARRSVVEWTAPALPADRPRYLMGVGYPEDILHAVAHGVDLFDCVLPSRNARHGNLFTREGILKIKNARFRDDPRPLDVECGCPLCRRGSRAFLHHLIRCGELTGAVLGTLHNLTFYLDFMADLRQAIVLGKLQGLATGSVPDRPHRDGPDETGRQELGRRGPARRGSGHPGEEIPEPGHRGSA